MYTLYLVSGILNLKIFYKWLSIKLSYKNSVYETKKMTIPSADKESKCQ